MDGFVDDSEPSLHFLSVDRSLDDFCGNEEIVEPCTTAIPADSILNSPDPMEDTFVQDTASSHCFGLSGGLATQTPAFGQPLQMQSSAPPNTTQPSNLSTLPPALPSQHFVPSSSVFFSEGNQAPTPLQHPVAGFSGTFSTTPAVGVTAPVAETQLISTPFSFGTSFSTADAESLQEPTCGTKRDSQGQFIPTSESAKPVGTEQCIPPRQPGQRGRHIKQSVPSVICGVQFPPGVEPSADLVEKLQELAALKKELQEDHVRSSADAGPDGMHSQGSGTDPPASIAISPTTSHPTTPSDFTTAAGPSTGMDLSSPVPGNQQQGVGLESGPADPERDHKRMRRIMSNRQSAARSRERKKQEYEALRLKVVDLARENAQLQIQQIKDKQAHEVVAKQAGQILNTNEQLQARIEALEAENSRIAADRAKLQSAQESLQQQLEGLQLNAARERSRKEKERERERDRQQNQAIGVTTSASASSAHAYDTPEVIPSPAPTSATAASNTTTTNSLTASLTHNPPLSVIHAAEPELDECVEVPTWPPPSRKKMTFWDTLKNRLRTLMEPTSAASPGGSLI